MAPLIGRETDVAQACALLDPADANARMLTLLGAGGVGKTRLALAVAPLPPVERPRHAQLVGDAERALDAERSARAWAEGQRLAPDLQDGDRANATRVSSQTQTAT